MTIHLNEYLYHTQECHHRERRGSGGVSSVVRLRRRPGTASEADRRLRASSRSKLKNPLHPPFAKGERGGLTHWESLARSKSREMFAVVSVAWHGQAGCSKRSRCKTQDEVDAEVGSCPPQAAARSATPQMGLFQRPAKKQKPPLPLGSGGRCYVLRS